MKDYKNNKGFTLFEMIVAVGVFGIISLIAVSTLLALIASQRKTSTFQNTQDNIRFALEAIAKEIRTGNNFWNCGSVPCGEFRFTNAKGESVQYYLDSGVIRKCSLYPACPAGSVGPMTAPEINVTDFDFYISGQDPLDDFQPRVTIVIRAVAGEEFVREQSEIQVQTTISQRRLDL